MTFISILKYLLIIIFQLFLFFGYRLFLLREKKKTIKDKILLIYIPYIRQIVSVISVIFDVLSNIPILQEFSLYVINIISQLYMLITAIEVYIKFIMDRINKINFLKYLGSPNPHLLLNNRV